LVFVAQTIWKPKKLQSQNEKSKTENKHNLNECLAKISNLEIELKEADDINNKKVDLIKDYPI